jgi:hypothetical protein
MMMKNEWILDILADLKSFARANGLIGLAEQLEDTSLIAAAEVTSAEEGLPGDADSERRDAGETTGGIGTIV